MVLAPFLAELVSGSTPPFAWILPPVLLTFCAIYGVSALLVREASVRLGGSPATVLLLGAAFGILNEGVAARSLFDPSWPALGALALYGRFGGVNWIWAEWIVPFHAVWSISFPVFLFRQLWPGSRSVRLLSDRWCIGLAAVPVAAAVVASTVIGSYRITAVDWAAMAAAMGVLIVLAWKLGPLASRWRPLGSFRPSPRFAAVVGALFFVGGQNGTWLTPSVSRSAVGGFVLVALLYLGVGLFASSLAADGPDDAPRFAFVLGGIGYYVALSPLSEFAFGRAGLLPIDVAVLALLILLYRKRTARRPEGAVAAAVGSA